MIAGVAALLLSATSSVFAQQTGTVNGQVVDNSTGKYLEGAEVSVNGTELRTTTERDGKFTLRNVPEGTHKITVNYTGLETNESSVDVKAGQTIDIPVKMASQEIITLGEFKVEGTKEGMAQAVALQKVSIESKLIAANDQFGTISEGNIGEYLKFLPGVGIVYNSNDARGIALRGMRSQFTTVAVDGTPMASASSSADSRRFETEQVSATNVEKNEIIKTMTADMPANSTGGYVNMVTKSAFDRQDEQRLEYRFYLTAPSTRTKFSAESGTWGKGKHYPFRPNFNVNFAKRVSEKFGFNINYQTAEIYHDSPRTQYTWLASGAAGSGAGAGGAAPTVADPNLNAYTQTNEQKLTHREALASKIDYNISDSTKLTFSGQWNWYDLTFQQRANVFNFGTTATGGLNNPDGANVSVASGNAANRSIQILPSQRNKYVTGVHFNTTLSHEFSDKSKAWITGYWSQADGKYRDTTKGYVANAAANYTKTNPIFTVSNVLSSPKHPGVDFNDGTTMAQVLDLANYTLQTTGTNLRSRPESALDTKDGVQAHYKYSFDTAIPISVQTGAAYDIVGRTIRRQEFRGSALAPALTGGALVDSLGSDYAFNYGYNYGTGRVLDLYKTYEKYGSLLGSANNLWSDSYRRFDEDNTAVYARADATFMKNLLLVGGVRWEKRNIDALAVNKTLAAGSYSAPLSTNVKYDNYYPSVSLRYSPTRNWVIRAGASRTVGDPDYSEVLPTYTAADNAALNNAVFTAPDKNLKPYYVNNYDLSVEYYFNKSGVLGGSIFRKNVSGFIISQTINAWTTVPVISASGAVITPGVLTPEAADMAASYGYPDALTVSQALQNTGSIIKKTNGAGSTVQGFELWYNQNLTFLPKPFDALNLQTNVSISNIKGDTLDTKYAQYVDAVTKAVNVQLSYRWRKVSVSVSTNWTGEVLGTVASLTAGGTNLLNTYKAPESKTKVAINYAYSQRYNAFFEIDNIGYQRRDFFRGYQSDTTQYELPSASYIYGDPVFRVGIKGAF
jgi:TonB-dependent receptor